MKLCYVPLLIAMQLPAAELKVDHVTIAGRDLGVWQKVFDAAGITCEFGGKHTNGMTEMAVASFPDGSYLEIIAAQPGADVSEHYWGRFIEQDAGACAWAVSVKSMSEEANRLHAAGIDIHPVASGRQRPDGVELRWRTATVGPPPQGSFFPFLIQDDTPRPLRVYPHGQPSSRSFEGVALVVIAVRDLNAAIEKWRSTFGLPEPRRQDDAYLNAHLAWFPETPVVLASGLAARIAKFGEGPAAFVLEAHQIPANANQGRGTWFGHPIAWFDPTALKGARIAASTAGLPANHMR